MEQNPVLVTGKNILCPLRKGKYHRLWKYLQITNFETGNPKEGEGKNGEGRQGERRARTRMLYTTALYTTSFLYSPKRTKLC